MVLYPEKFAEMGGIDLYLHPFLHAHRVVRACLFTGFIFPNLPLRLLPVLNFSTILADSLLVEFMSSLGDLLRQTGRCFGFGLWLRLRFGFIFPNLLLRLYPVLIFMTVLAASLFIEFIGALGDLRRQTGRSFGFGLRFSFGFGFRLRFGFGFGLRFGFGFRLRFGFGFGLRLGFSLRFSFGFGFRMRLGFCLGLRLGFGFIFSNLL